MTAAVLERGMAKAGRPKGERDDVPVKLDRALVDRARVIAAYRRTTLADLLSTLLKGPIDKAHSQMASELSRDANDGA